MFIGQFLLRCMECRRGIGMKKLSVRPSVKCVDCDKTEERSVEISIPYHRSFSLVFWEEEWLVGVQYKLCATVHRCLQHKAPEYMIDCCDITRRQHLQSAGYRQLLVPSWHHHSMFSRRAFSVAGPVAWNSLPDYLQDPTRSIDSFRRDLKTLFFLVLLVYTVH